MGLRVSTQPLHNLRRASLVMAIMLVLAAPALAAPKAVVISLDGRKPAIVQQLLASGALLSDPNFYGAHGHNPRQPDMDAFFAISNQA